MLVGEILSLDRVNVLDFLVGELIDECAQHDLGQDEIVGHLERNDARFAVLHQVEVNVILERAGQDAQDQRVIVLAHLDCVAIASFDFVQCEGVRVELLDEMLGEEQRESLADGRFTVDVHRGHTVLGGDERTRLVASKRQKR